MWIKYDCACSVGCREPICMKLCIPAYFCIANTTVGLSDLSMHSVPLYSSGNEKVLESSWKLALVCIFVWGMRWKYHIWRGTHGYATDIDFHRWECDWHHTKPISSQIVWNFVWPRNFMRATRQWYLLTRLCTRHPCNRHSERVTSI